MRAKTPMSDLRHRAEKQLNSRLQRPDLKRIPWTDLEKLVYELEVHQIELEMQNEELRRAQEELEDSRLKYFDLFELAPVGYATMSPLGIIREVNLTAASMLGIERSRLIGRAFSWYVDESSQEAWLSLLMQVRDNGDKRSGELALIQRRDEKDSRRVLVELMTAVGNADLIRVNLVDITESKRAAEELRESEERYRTLFESIDEGFCIVEALFAQNGRPVDYRFLETNPAFETQTGLRDVVGKRIRELAPNHEEHWFDIYGRIALTGEPERFTREAKYLDNRWFDVYAFKVGRPEERKVAILFNDITARKRNEEELRRQKDQMRLLIDALPALMAFVDTDRRYVIVNKPYERWFGRPAEEIIGKTVQEILGDEAYEVISEYVDAALSGLQVTYESIVPYKGVGSIHVRTTLAPFICEEGKLRGYFALIQDITQQKEDEEKLKVAVVERETLLGEIHHRVKNNLAVINSLLNLQMGKTPEESARLFIQDCQSRIRSMALIHESLYQAKDFSRLHLRDYVSSLVNALLSTYRVSSSRVRLDLDIEQNILLPLDCTVPCGLILNELISNSLKHAFPPGHSGVITIQGRQTGDGEVELKVSDNGVGIPDHVDIRKTGQLGLQLVISLVERQLKGTLGVQIENGTTFLIAFDPSRFMRA